MIKYNISFFITLFLILVSWILISCDKKDNSEILKQIEKFENSINENKKEITINIDEIGSWNNGKINEKGEIIFSDGRVFYGEWRDGEPNGTGKITIPYLDHDGFIFVEDNEENNNSRTTEITIDYGLVDNYEGEWKDGKRHGFGRTTWRSDDYYEGEYKDGLMNGEGFLIGQEWGKYVGGWKNDKPHGLGTFTFLDGEKWKGEFREGKFLDIIVYDKEGKILKGNLFGLFAITRSVVNEPFEYEIKAAKGEHTLIETVYDTMW